MHKNTTTRTRDDYLHGSSTGTKGSSSGSSSGGGGGGGGGLQSMLYFLEIFRSRNPEMYQEQLIQKDFKTM